MRLALDSNILVYAEGVNGEKKKRMAVDILQKLDPAELVIPVQALGELFHVLVRKAGFTAARAQKAVHDWHELSNITETSWAVLSSAIKLASTHHLSIWDSVILATAAESHCRLLLSEDLQNGFGWAGVTVCNPFSSSGQALLQSLFA